MEVQDLLRQLRFNGQSLDRGGPLDPSLGGFTTSNAPQIFARLLTTLSQPGGPLSSLESSRVLGGQVAGITAAADQERRSTSARLAGAGLNEAQAGAALSGIDVQTMRAITEARAEEQRRLSGAQQEALTSFAGAVAQSEATQKERAEDLRRFEIALREMRKQQRFSRIISIASLGVSAFGAGMIGNPFTALFGSKPGAGTGESTLVLPRPRN